MRRRGPRRLLPDDAAGAAAGSQAFYTKHVPQEVKGLYLVKFAVSLSASYLGIQLLITFAEVLLPFIFAVLCMMILDPLKVFIMRVLQRLSVKAFTFLGLKVCLEYSNAPVRGESFENVNDAAATMYGRLPQDSPQEDSSSGQSAEQRVAEPTPGVKKAVLALSILLCMLLTGRALWLTAKVFVRAGMTISKNLGDYKKGADHLKRWFHTYIEAIHIEALDYNKLLDGLVAEVENIGTVVTESVLYTGLQAVVTFIFLVYMLWSPIKMESSVMSKEVFSSTARYLKVKCLISALTGLCAAATLWAIGLDLPAAFGLLAFLANFLPGIGSFVASVLPCILAVIDARKTPTQVLLAFACQAAVHFCVDFFVEPVFFGISVEIHSVIVILGIWFFYQVWGVPGMLLSVPLLAVLRIMMKSMKRAAASLEGGEEQDTIIFLDNILEGRWMSTVGSSRAEEELDMYDFSDKPSKELDMYDFSDKPSKDSLPIGRRRTGSDPHGENSEARRQRADTVDIWAALLSSKAGQDAWQLYQSNRLLADCALLLFLIGLTIFAPL